MTGLQLRLRFFKKIQDWILKSKRTRKWILRFFTKQITPRSSGSQCIKGTEESTLEVDSSIPLTHLDPRYLGLICLVKKRKIHFQILSDLRIQSWIFLKKRTLNITHKVETICFLLFAIHRHLSYSSLHTFILHASTILFPSKCLQFSPAH